MSGMLIKDWIKKAEEDYEAAVTLLRKRGKATPDAVCFHAQQCVEKYIKAFIVSHRKEIPRTHQLTSLLKMAAEFDSSLHLIHDLVAFLNPYAEGRGETCR